MSTINPNAITHDAAYLQQKLNDIARDNPLTALGSPFEDITTFGEGRTTIELYKDGYRIFVTQVLFPKATFKYKKILIYHQAYITFTNGSINIEITMKKFAFFVMVFWSCTITSMIVDDVINGGVFWILLLLPPIFAWNHFKKQKKLFISHVVDLLNHL